MEKILDTMTRIPKSIEVLSDKVDYVCTFRNEEEPELIYTSSGDLSLEGFSSMWEMTCHPEYAMREYAVGTDVAEVGLIHAFQYEQCRIL